MRNNPTQNKFPGRHWVIKTSVLFGDSSFPSSAESELGKAEFFLKKMGKPSLFNSIVHPIPCSLILCSPGLEDEDEGLGIHHRVWDVTQIKDSPPSTCAVFQTVPFSHHIPTGNSPELFAVDAFWGFFHPRGPWHPSRI